MPPSLCVISVHRVQYITPKCTFLYIFIDDAVIIIFLTLAYDNLHFLSNVADFSLVCVHGHTALHGTLVEDKSGTNKLTS